MRYFDCVSLCVHATYHSLEQHLEWHHRWHEAEITYEQWKVWRESH